MNSDRRSRWFDRRNWSFATRFTLAIVLLGTVTIAAVIFLTTRTVRDALVDQVGESYSAQAESLNNLVSSFLKEKVTQIVALAVVDTIKTDLKTRNAAYTGSDASILAEIQALDEQWVAAGDDDPLIQRILATDPALNPTTFQIVDLLRVFPAHTEIFVTDRYGATLGATARLSDYYQADEDWWQAAWNNGQGAIYISDPEVDESAGVTALLIAVPIFDEESGEALGIVRSTLNTAELFALINSVRFGQTGHAILFDRSAEVLYEPATEGQAGTADLPLNQRQQLLQAEQFVTASDADGDEAIWGHQPIAAVVETGSGAEVDETEAAIATATANLGWTIAIKQKAQETFASSNQLVRNILIAGVAAAVLTGMAGMFTARTATRPLLTLATAAKAIGEGILVETPELNRRDEVGVLAQAFNSMAAQLRDLIGNLEQRVADRTRELERRSRYLEATSDVAQNAASVLALDELLDQTATLVSERFDFYHTGIFLLDPSREWAVLQAASSEGGQRMLDQGHRLRVGEAGMVGYVTARGESRIALDVGADAVHFDNPHLPDTRSEMALPLLARGEVIGALDVQSTEPEAFSDEDVSVLQTLADQVALAINNARLFQQAQESLEAARRAYGDVSREGWRELLSGQTDLGFFSNQQDTTPAGDLWRPEMERALRTGEATPGNEDNATLAIPIKVRDQVIGVVDGRKPDGTGEWSPQEIELLQALTDQLESALEGARLYRDSQRRATQERLISEITTRMRETLDVGKVMETAADEMYRSLELGRVAIRLATEDSLGDIQEQI